MLDKVFPISGNKISSFIADDDALKFSSSTSETTVDSFKESFAKKLSLATKIEIKYDSIKSIKKEDNDLEVLIKYKNFVGLPIDFEFSFADPTDCDTFFTFLERERFFTKINEVLTPFKAIRNYLIGLFATIGFTIFTYYQAIEISKGNAEEAHSWKVRLFNYVARLLGEKGILAIGVILSGFLLYIIWKRYKNPPNQIKFIPSNG